MDYWNLKDQSSTLVVFKVQWFRSIVEYDQCMFYAINNTQVHQSNRLKDQSFVFPKSMEQVFFCANWLKLGQLIVLQKNPRLFRVLGKLALAWDDGSHVVGSSCTGIFQKHTPLKRRYLKFLWIMTIQKMEGVMKGRLKSSTQFWETLTFKTILIIFLMNKKIQTMSFKE